MIHDFGQQHPGLTLVIIAILLMLNAWVDYYGADLKPIAYVSWFLGGALGVVALSCCTGGYLLFLGILRWPVAAAVFVAAMYALYRFRPKNRNRH